MNERELRATAKSHGVLSLEQTRDIIDTADLVWGVVPDGAMMIIKGVPTLEFIVSTDVSEEMSVTAVHIESLEQGRTLLNVFRSRILKSPMTNKVTSGRTVNARNTAPRTTAAISANEMSE